MKRLHTFESFLNEAKKSSKVITLRKFLSKDHNALWKWMQKEFGQKYSPGLQRIAGPLTHGGDFTLDVSNWDEKDIEALKDYLSSNDHVFESFLNEATSMPKDAPRVVQDLFNKKAYVEITAKTKLKKGAEILGIYSGMFYTIGKVNGNIITIIDDSFGDEDNISHEDLLSDFLIKK